MRLTAYLVVGPLVDADSGRVEGAYVDRVLTEEPTSLLADNQRVIRLELVIPIGLWSMPVVYGTVDVQVGVGS